VENGITALDMTKIGSVAELEAAGITANPTAQGVVAILALAANVICFAVILKRSFEQKKNPYKNEIFVGTRDFEEAMARRE
ncbi:MAG: hypothetical protein IKX99_02990, partial [Lachnospiraceae bacterium]|nr:hypothetical protein [Lachnospiraceae bacterium]